MTMFTAATYQELIGYIYDTPDVHDLLLKLHKKRWTFRGTDWGIRTYIENISSEQFTRSLTTIELDTRLTEGAEQVCTEVAEILEKIRFVNPHDAEMLRTALVQNGIR